MGHSHPPAAERKLLLCAGLTIAFVFAEGAAGIASHSLALVSDAGHNFTDAAALLLSWYAVWITRRPASQERTFGYHRAGILAALINAVSLVLIALFILWEAIQRLRAPQEIAGAPMIVLGLAAIGMNLAIGFWLTQEAKNDLNIRSAYIHMMGDAASAAGVVIAGVLVRFVGLPLADPLISLLIAGLILWSSWGILKEAVDILLEGSPAGLEMPEVEDAIAGVPGVIRAHDLHVWTIGSGVTACSCHIVVAEQSVRSGQQVLRAVTAELERRFHINHTTLQVEVEGCEPNDMYCVMKVSAHPPHTHG